MKIKYKAGEIDACDPINDLLNALREKGFLIEKSKVSDYHFNELYFLLKADRNDINFDDVNIENIERHSINVFYCKCHWSMAELLTR